MNKKVRLGQTYIYDPVLFDQLHPPFGVLRGNLKQGQKVKVINIRGCPPANTMGNCYISNLDGFILGMASTNSLISIKEWEERQLK